MKMLDFYYIAIYLVMLIAIVLHFTFRFLIIKKKANGELILSKAEHKRIIFIEKALGTALVFCSVMTMLYLFAFKKIQN